MRITATVFYSYHICPREAWLYHRGISSDKESPYLVIGRLFHNIYYKRHRKELFIDRLLKIDLFRGELVAEVKKSSRHKEAARLQLGYYLYYLKYEKGVNLKGILLFPKERRTEMVELSPDLEEKIRKTLRELEELLSQEKPPPAVRIRYCKTCAFQEFCWA